MSEEVSALDLLKQQLEYLTEGMKPLHLLLAQGVAAGKTQEQAYKDAGGKAKDPRASASKLIATNRNIQQYIDLAAKIAVMESQEALVATADQKRRALWDITQRCMTEVEPKYVGHGEEKELVGYVFDSRGAIGAIAELNKMDGDLAAIKTDNKHTHEYEDLSDEDLDREIAERTGAKPS